MKDKKITETSHGRGVYVMEVKSGENSKVRGNNQTERLQNAVKDFLKTVQKTSARERYVR